MVCYKSSTNYFLDSRKRRDTSILWWILTKTVFKDYCFGHMETGPLKQQVDIYDSKRVVRKVVEEAAGSNFPVY